ncbi:hypothetical protein ABPG77_002618 [Micractinium sp. CCAP 211/92]
MGCCSSKPASNSRADIERETDAHEKEGARVGNASAAAARPANGQQQGTEQGRAAPPVVPTLPLHRLGDGAPSSLGTSDSSDSDSDSNWDELSWRRDTERTAPHSPGLCSSRDTVGSMSLLGSLTTQLRLRQDSIFGLSSSPLLSPVRDSARLRLCKVAGCTFVNQYMVVKYLGRGSSGRVFLCMSIEDHRLYAVKIVRKDQAGSKARAAGSAAAAAPGGRRRPGRCPLEDLRREIEVMRRVLHPNVVALREVVDDQASNKMLLVMDYLEGGPVMTREGLERGHRIPEEVARLYFQDMCTALAYLHSQRVVHGDLKPENALMGACGRVALSDFGCSKLMRDEEDGLFDRCNGTPAFLAPEMMEPHARYRGRPADVYALGCCLYAFVFGHIPFRADTVMQLFEVVRSTPVSFPGEVPASAALQDLLLGMLEKDPARRLTLEQVQAHPWLAAGGASPVAPQPGHGQPQNGVAPGGHGAASGGGSAAAGSGLTPGPQAVPPGLAPDLQQGQPAAAHGLEEGSTEGSSGASEAAEAGQQAQRDRLLRAALMGLVTGDLPVLTFAAGEALMCRGQPGCHMFYIIDGECEVIYRPLATRLPEDEAGAAPSRPSTAGSASVDPPPRPQSAAHRPPHPPSQQQRQQPHAAQAADSARPPVASQPSAAALFSVQPSTTSELPVPAADAWPATQPVIASSSAGAVSAAGAPAGMLAEDSGLSSSSSMQLEAAGRGGLYARRTATFIAEAAEGAEAELATAGLRPQHSSQALRPQQQAELPAPGAAQRREPLSVPPPLTIPLADEPSTPALPTELAVASSAAGTPTPSSPVRGATRSAAAGGSGAASVSASAAPSPGPFGLRRQMGVDMEGASAELLSPSHPPRPSAEAATAARLHGSDSPLPELAAAQGGPAGQGQAQQMQQGWPQNDVAVGNGEAPQQEQPQRPPPRVEGEELPPSLIQAASRAQELLASLRRGPASTWWLCGARGTLSGRWKPSAEARVGASPASSPPAAASKRLSSRTRQPGPTCHNTRWPSSSWRR